MAGSQVKLAQLDQNMSDELPVEGSDGLTRVPERH